MHHMTAMSAGVSVLAHGIHYAVLGVGLLGLAVLLGPRLAGPRQIPVDAHDERVRALRRQLRSGPATLALPVVPTRLVLARSRSTAETLLLPLAVVSSAAAAGVHAAVGPAHLREQTLFGAFFAGSALLQILWAALVVLRPTRTVFLAGVVGNLAVLGLWVLTRTAGLPFGLMPTPEAVGPWDLTCAAWEVVVVTTGVALLHSGEPRPRLLAWTGWSVAARSWAALSVGVLVALTFSGAGA
jgi:hypothetical protein